MPCRPPFDSLCDWSVSGIDTEFYFKTLGLTSRHWILLQDTGSDLTTLALHRCARRTLLCCTAHRSHYGTWVPRVTFCRESRH
ncbi:hypothetical protein PSCLAVI8L_130094 [Pseudoclavibacter sp. 8L]|nr:hypothetical protein PSCLAVI8L_130094 [Pseudoclavibacter sp. 8L]